MAPLVFIRKKDPHPFDLGNLHDEESPDELVGCCRRNRNRELAIREVDNFLNARIAIIRQLTDRELRDKFYRLPRFSNEDRS